MDLDLDLDLDLDAASKSAAAAFAYNALLKSTNTARKKAETMNRIPFGFTWLPLTSPDFPARSGLRHGAGSKKYVLVLKSTDTILISIRRRKGKVPVKYTGYVIRAVPALVAKREN